MLMVLKSHLILDVAVLSLWCCCSTCDSCHLEGITTSMYLKLSSIKEWGQQAFLHLTLSLSQYLSHILCDLLLK
ncbi:hypothetical protein EDC04DRAFT_2829159 [Pisolithus marmoratus]|nr:hypothetical protein EDC04DRAFT_2829159 [Pisolithus marmoratus]